MIIPYMAESFLSAKTNITSSNMFMNPSAITCSYSYSIPQVLNTSLASYNYSIHCVLPQLSIEDNQDIIIKCNGLFLGLQLAS